MPNRGFSQDSKVDATLGWYALMWFRCAWLASYRRQQVEVKVLTTPLSLPNDFVCSWPNDFPIPMASSGCADGLGADGTDDPNSDSILGQTRSEN